MTNKELIDQIRNLARAERHATARLLRALILGERRRVYLDLSHASMYAWLTKDLGFSNSAAQRRLEAARFLAKAPRGYDKFESGRLNLSALSRAQTVTATAERRRGEIFSQQVYEDLLESLEGKSTLDLERELIKRFPDAVVPGGPDSTRAADADNLRVSVTCPNEFEPLLQRARELLSNEMPHASTGEILVVSLRELVEDRVKSTTASVDGCVNPGWAKKRKALLHRAKHQCEHVDPETGIRCPSRFRLEIDHILPKAKG